MTNYSYYVCNQSVLAHLSNKEFMYVYVDSFCDKGNIRDDGSIYYIVKFYIDWADLNELNKVSTERILIKNPADEELTYITLIDSTIKKYKSGDFTKTLIQAIHNNKWLIANGN